jgi:hypothetical protein
MQVTLYILFALLFVIGIVSVGVISSVHSQVEKVRSDLADVKDMMHYSKTETVLRNKLGHYEVEKMLVDDGVITQDEMDAHPYLTKLKKFKEALLQYYSDKPDAVIYEYTVNTDAIELTVDDIVRELSSNHTDQHENIIKNLVSKFDNKLSVIEKFAAIGVPLDYVGNDYVVKHYYGYNEDGDVSTLLLGETAVTVEKMVSYEKTIDVVNGTTTQDTKETFYVDSDRVKTLKDYLYDTDHQAYLITVDSTSTTTTVSYQNHTEKIKNLLAGGWPLDGGSASDILGLFTMKTVIDNLESTALTGEYKLQDDTSIDVSVQDNLTLVEVTANGEKYISLKQATDDDGLLVKGSAS